MDNEDVLVSGVAYTNALDRAEHGSTVQLPTHLMPQLQNTE
jgi:hypothetical protein